MCKGLLPTPKIETSIAPTPTDLPDKPPEALGVKPESDASRKRKNPLRIDLASSGTPAPASGVNV